MLPLVFHISVLGYKICYLYILAWAKKKKIWIWALLFTGQFCIGIRTPQKKFQIYRPINDSLLAISILGVFTM